MAFFLTLFPSLASTLLTLLASLALWIALHRWSHRSFKGPPSWPLLGAALDVARHSPVLHDYITDYSRRYRTFFMPNPGRDQVYTAEPAIVEYMLKTNFANYVKGTFTYVRQKELFGDGIFNVDGEAWKQQRKVASFEFTSRAIRDFSEITFRDYTSKLANILVAECRAKRPVEMQSMIMRMTMDSICKLGFGIEMGCLLKHPPPAERAFSKAFDSVSVAIFWRFLDPFWKLKNWLKLGTEAELVKDVAILDNFVYKVIEERKIELQESRDQGKGAAKPDLLSRFLALSESDPKEYTEKKIRDIILNFMVAGRDTTAITLSWFLYSLSKNPRVEEKLMHEIFDVETDDSSLDDIDDHGFPSDERIKKFTKLLTYERLQKMTYLQACLTETLRLYPAVPLEGRVAAGPDVLPDGTKMRTGDYLFFSPYAMGRMDWIWGADVTEFKPERFFNGGTYQQEPAHKLTAFLAGPRLCLGKEFAYLQMKVIAAILLRFFKFELYPGHKVHYRLMLTLHMSTEGLKMNVLPRPIHKSSS